MKEFEYSEIKFNLESSFVDCQLPESGQPFHGFVRTDEEHSHNR